MSDIQSGPDGLWSKVGSPNLCLADDEHYHLEATCPLLHLPVSPLIKDEAEERNIKACPVCVS